uniref:Drebrin-like protein B n=3 Tax=Lygus hesperus TaxID=30085 RepID=A0A0A9ZIV2_LYGHE
MAINLTKNRDAILDAWKDVVDGKTSTDWALFGYEGQSNDLEFVAKGDGGLEELQTELNSGTIQYAFARVLDPKTTLPKCVLINWQGEGAPFVRKGTCANHFRDVERLLKGAHITINARNDEEVDPDVIMDKVSKSTCSTYSFTERIGEVDRQTAPVGTVYKRVIPKNEINVEERDKFWQKEELEEKQRQVEEKRKREEMKRLDKEKLEKEAELAAQERESPEQPARRIESSNRKEAEELIKLRTTDARAIFEQNTNAGQLLSSKKSSFEASNPEIKDEEPIVVEELLSAAADELLDTGLKAEALYDYQAADETEISFDPGDIITHIERIDPGWWQGLAPDGSYGLFPANYVQLIE